MSENYSIEAFLIADVISSILPLTSLVSSTIVPVTIISPPAFAAVYAASPSRIPPVSYTHLDVYKRQIIGFEIV